MAVPCWFRQALLYKYPLQVNASCLETLEATLNVSLLAEGLRKAGPIFYCTEGRCIDCKETEAYPVLRMCACSRTPAPCWKSHPGQQLQEKVVQKHTSACCSWPECQAWLAAPLAVMLPRLPGWLGRPWCSGGAYAMHIFCCLTGLVHK